MSPNKVRVRCVSGQFDGLDSTFNFSKRLVNIGLGGMCIETTGRLRPDVNMSAEIRFDEFGGTLRSQACILWTQTVNEGATEIHLAGLRFIEPELTNPVREYLEGGRVTLIVTKRRAEYEDLKEKSEARKAAVGPKKWSVLKKTVASFLVLIFCYVASYGGWVTAGRRESPSRGSTIDTSPLSRQPDP